MANAHALHVGALGLIPAPHSLLSTSWNHLNQQARNSSKHYSIWPTNQNLQKTVNFFLWCKNGSRGQSGSLMGRALFTCAKPVFHCRFHIIPSPVPQSEEPCQLPPNPASSPSDLNSNNGLFFTTIIHYGPWMLSWAPKRAKSQHGSWDREHKTISLESLALGMAPGQGSSGRKQSYKSYLTHTAAQSPATACWPVAFGGNGRWEAADPQDPSSFWE